MVNYLELGSQVGKTLRDYIIMTQTHLLSDGLTRIRNAQAVFAKDTILLYSRLVVSVLKVIVQEGYIITQERFSIRKGVDRIKVQLKYSDNGKVPAINEILTVSKPGRRTYISSIDLINSCSGKLGTVILSTSRGIVSHSIAKKYKSGGEVLCKIF